MRRIGAAAIMMALVSGCMGSSGNVLTDVHDMYATDVSHRPDSTRTASLLLAAGEDEWRKEVDVGPMEFDDEGAQVIDKEAVKRARPKLWGFRMGFSPELDVHNDDGVEKDAWEDGPFVGFYMGLGPKKGRFAVEFGVDISDIRGEYHNSPTNFESFLIQGRVDSLYFVSAHAKKTRFYVIGGLRGILESTKVYYDFYEQDYKSSTMGWGVGGGMTFKNWDFRFMRSEADSGQARVGFNRFTAAYRF